MNQLLLTDWLQIISFAGVAVALVANVAAMLRRRGEQERADEDRAVEMVAAQRQTAAQLQAIERKTDGIAAKLDHFTERLVAAEGSAKSAHHRLDEIRKAG